MSAAAPISEAEIAEFVARGGTITRLPPLDMNTAVELALAVFRNTDRRWGSGKKRKARDVANPPLPPDIEVSTTDSADTHASGRLAEGYPDHSVARPAGENLQLKRMEPWFPKAPDFHLIGLCDEHAPIERGVCRA